MGVRRGWSPAADDGRPEGETMTRANRFLKFIPDAPPPGKNPCPACGAERDWTPQRGADGALGWVAAETCDNCARLADEQKRRAEVCKNLTETLMARGIPLRYAGSTINDLEDVTSNVIEAFSRAVTKRESVVLYGGVGSGKTLLACCLLRRIIENGANPDKCGFVVVPNMLAEMRAAMDEAGKVPEHVVRDIIRYDVLILDDIGAEYDTGWAREVMYRVVNDRYNALKQTIFTTNYRPDANGEMAKTLGKRIVSRLASYICLYTGDKDRR